MPNNAKAQRRRRMAKRVCGNCGEPADTMLEWGEGNPIPICGRCAALLDGTPPEVTPRETAPSPGYRSLHEGISAVFEKPAAEFMAKKRKNDLAMMLLQVQVEPGLRALMAEEVAQTRVAMQGQLEEVEKDRDWYRERLHWWRDLAEQRRLESVATNVLSPDVWRRLKDFSDRQLRHWVRVGAAMERKGHGEAVRNAVQWVADTIPAVSTGP